MSDNNSSYSVLPGSALHRTLQQQEQYAFQSVKPPYPASATSTYIVSSKHLRLVATTYDPPPLCLQIKDV